MDAQRQSTDDEGNEVRLPRTVRRVVSLVPSLTEAVAVTAPGLLVGATDWCTHPAGLDVARIGGTKNPAVAAVCALRPDLVVANEEENRAPDLAALRAAGLPVWTTRIRDLDQALDSLHRLLVDALQLPCPGWLVAARQAWAFAPPTRTVRAVAPIWRRPWMVLGRDTFAADLLRRLGVDLLPTGNPDRYPRLSLDELRSLRPELLLLPDEPYRFTATDGPDAFPGLPYALLSGRHLTWYGPSLAEAPAVLGARVAVSSRSAG
ncbi:helical backbone metal receptor [Kitasatospora sp. YST-16]|uniref:helical backbone metal receptor n=1 Tax=Kitasatospora sp. YST-16 TaxID=2998080 RepID=UPI002284E75D|nr:helical backbone metal receptor [Kitasatospora sp. YST-16]WAL70636.1 helical backbone metal receptor [Kitasatospora sp. YST-16]WNW36677.1 helical backbone metal receptor [Streptomyces sp. Li-HN-5-13]